ncbi:hypothetical protein QLL95_gp0323 [Cotonvirus japonicus]|uniref:Uncharacterized protein n=1 Tax=Cotonvirus japonicus TaxID=2811091 RepID=A0ABM7NRM1_9VIRU|nr:hypothetical protein QLL95_gp0323 [Cotonvirus japonicus]BCS82812.1 hypothetical protein [Cotonvirus japonicus]
MTNILKRFYYYPLSGTGITNVLVYKIILGLNDTCVIKYIKNKLIDDYISESTNIPAYISLYENSIELPIINKQCFHLQFDVKGRIPIGTSVNDYLILKTSGSTSGTPSSIPVSEIDITRLRNYYTNLARVSGGIMPCHYKYINMFPASDSSTGKFSELLIPENFRLERSNADPNLTIETIQSAIDTNILKNKTPIVVAGLPILHLMLIETLNDYNDESDVTNYLKNNGVCLYGGESPTILERLQLYRYYSKLFGVYGSTEMGPRLGFALEPNLIIDIALSIPEISSEITNSTSPAISFFYDKYMHNYEIINGSLVNTPLIQQAELKIRWDQEDQSEIINTMHVKRVIAKYEYLLIETFKTYNVIDDLNADILRSILHDFLHTNTYKKLTKYYGLILLYGRKGVIFGGANLDSKFVEIVANQIDYDFGVNHLALHRNNTNSKSEISTKNYSGLTLDILVETQEILDNDTLLKLKPHIIELMEHQHHDFEQIMQAYRAKDQEHIVMSGINLFAYESDSSPMHFRHEQSGKKIYVVKNLKASDREACYAIV